MSNLNAKKAIVFGGTSGIGLEIAKLLLKAGAKVVTVSRRESSIEGMQHEVADVLDRQALEKLFEKHTGFDFLVNAATGGARAIGPFLEMDLDGFQGSFRVGAENFPDVIADDLGRFRHRMSRYQLGLQAILA